MVEAAGARLAVLVLSLLLPGCRSAARVEPVLPQGAGSVARAALTSNHRPSPAITGLRADLIDEEHALPDGRISWWSRWRACWAPVPDAVGYYVTAITPEGAGPPQRIEGPCHTLTVATGVAQWGGERPGRAAQLGLMQASLSVRIGARLRDGTFGPLSPAVLVGRPYP